MKSIKSTPKNKGFFEIYAALIITLRKSGYAAQIISALTEVGGIYATAYAALIPIMPGYAIYIAGIMAIIGTAVIELGLRQLLPHTIDSILYKRFSGLHLPITILIWLSALMLLGASGVLSFQNSKTIVEQVTPEAQKEDTFQTDSIYQLQTAAASAQFSQDSAMIAQRFNALIEANTTAYKGKIDAQQKVYYNLKKKEARTGQKYPTAKDKIKVSIAELKAEQATKLAELETNRASELATLQSDYKAITSEARAERKTGIAEVKAINQAAEDKRQGKVSTYGGGLAYFTIICLVVLIVSIVLDRIHKKGSGIEEKVSLSQYDISPSAWVEFSEAIRERWQYGIRSRINAFAEKTPPPPLPVSKSPVYDATAITEDIETIKYEEGEEQEEKIIYLPKRRRIGFNHWSDLYSTRKRAGHIHETPTETSPKTAHETPELRQLKQRLKMYKKRLGSHQQKALKQERKNGKVNKRTTDAITNNQHWVEHYSKLIEQAEIR